MNSKNRGFTLIELLIVVLIIAILAAIALPQYQKAVMKSRYSAMMPIAKALSDGNEVYYMEHGNYSENPTDLLIAGKAKNEAYLDGTSVLLYDANGLSYVRVSNSSVPRMRYLVYQKHSANFAGTTMCEAGDDRAHKICQILGGKLLPGISGNSQGDDYTAYLLSGTVREGDLFSGNGNNSASSTCTGETPSTINASEYTNGINGAVGTATCVNGQWVYEWTGGFKRNSGSAKDVAGYPYRYAGAEYEAGGCVAQVEYGCAHVQYSGDNTACVSNSGNPSGCAYSTFSGTNGYCQGWNENACGSSTFSGEGSRCIAAGRNVCAGSIVQPGAYCQSAISNGCEGVSYPEDQDGNRGCCAEDGSSTSCVSGSPKCGADKKWDGTYW